MDKGVQVLSMCTVHAVDDDNAQNRRSVQCFLLFCFSLFSCA